MGIGSVEVQRLTGEDGGSSVSRTDAVSRVEAASSLPCEHPLQGVPSGRCFSTDLVTVELPQLL